MLMFAIGAGNLYTGVPGTGLLETVRMSLARIPRGVRG